MIVTIVIPSYNQQEYLADAIESALGQTVPCEVIVVDDGSTDNSLEIAKRYQVKVIEQVNKGLSSARNTGIMNATGDYVLFLDADDALLPNCVERILQESDADIIAPSFKTFGISNEVVLLMLKPELKDFRIGNRVAYCCAIKREILLKVGGYSPRMTYGYEDLHLMINLLTKGYKIVTIPEVLWFYRTKEQSMIHDAQKHHQELLDQINKDFPEAKINYGTTS